MMSNKGAANDNREIDLMQEVFKALIGYPHKSLSEEQMVLYEELWEERARAFQKNLVLQIWVLRNNRVGTCYEL